MKATLPGSFPHFISTKKKGQNQKRFSLSAGCAVPCWSPFFRPSFPSPRPRGRLEGVVKITAREGQSRRRPFWSDLFHSLAGLGPIPPEQRRVGRRGPGRGKGLVVVASQYRLTKLDQPSMGR